jgi:hypothetical protein
MDGWRYASSISALVTRSRCDQLYTPSALPPGKQPPVLIYRRLGGPQSRCGRYGEEKNLLPPPGIVPRLLGREARGLVVIPFDLYGLQQLKESAFFFEVIAVITKNQMKEC